MINIKTIIKEEICSFLFENDDDILYDLHDKKTEITSDLFSDFLINNNENYTKNVPWRLIPFNQLKRVWEDYIKYGYVRHEKPLQNIERIIIANTIKIYIFTELLGHTSYSPDEDYDEYIGYHVRDYIACYRKRYFDGDQLEIDFEKTSGQGKRKSPIGDECNGTTNPYLDRFINENGLDELGDDDLYRKLYDELVEKFKEYYSVNPKSGHSYISDFKPLITLLYDLMRQSDPQERLVTIDKMLNVVHQRSDIASWFVEGGSNALSQLSGYVGDDVDSNISGNYSMSDYN